LKRRRVQAKKRPIRKRSLQPKRSGPPPSFGEMILNWVLIVLILLILGFVGSWAWRFFAPHEPANLPASGPEKKVEILREIPRVEVLNGCGVSGIAAKVGNFLRKRGYDVVNTDNYRTFSVDSTFIIDRRSLRAEYGRRLAEVLGVPRARVSAILNEDLSLEATVVLGKDYRQLKAFRP